MVPDDLKWYHFSSCQNLDINLFYDDYESDPVLAANVDDICVTCPVRAICRQEGEDNGETGVWGGVYLTNGKKDTTRNAHKTTYVWNIVNDY